MAEELSVATLLSAARTAAGLDDFGDEWFLGPLAKLVECVNAEAGLAAPTGGPVDRIVQGLIDRLKLVELLKREPDILNERLNVAGVIVGLPRTGSTIMHRLLAASPRLTSPWWWEVTFPLPLPGEMAGDPTPRRELAKRLVAEFLAAWPDFESIDPIDAEAVAEEVILLDKSFLSTTYDSMMNVPSYGVWQAGQDHVQAYRELETWLKVLQRQQPWRRERGWILKTPHHLLGGMSGLLAVFPDAKLIMTHRDPAEVLPSYCSMCASMTVNASTTYRRESQGAYWMQRFATGLKRFQDIRKILPPGRVIDIRYKDTVSNPAGAASAAMRAMGLEPDGDDLAAFARCIEDNARDKRPPHKYNAAAFGLDPDGMRAAFAFYGIP